MIDFELPADLVELRARVGAFIRDRICLLYTSASASIASDSIFSAMPPISAILRPRFSRSLS